MSKSRHHGFFIFATDGDGPIQRGDTIYAVGAVSTDNVRVEGMVYGQEDQLIMFLKDAYGMRTIPSNAVPTHDHYGQNFRIIRVPFRSLVSEQSGRQSSRLPHPEFIVVRNDSGNKFKIIYNADDESRPLSTTRWLGNAARVQQEMFTACMDHVRSVRKNRDIIKASRDTIVRLLLGKYPRFGYLQSTAKSKRSVAVDQEEDDTDSDDDDTDSDEDVDGPAPTEMGLTTASMSSKPHSRMSGEEVLSSLNRLFLVMQTHQIMTAMRATDPGVRVYVDFVNDDPHRLVHVVDKTTLYEILTNLRTSQMQPSGHLAELPALKHKIRGETWDELEDENKKERKKRDDTEETERKQDRDREYALLNKVLDGPKGRDRAPNVKVYGEANVYHGVPVYGAASPKKPIKSSFRSPATERAERNVSFQLRGEDVAEDSDKKMKTKKSRETSTDPKKPEVLINHYATPSTYLRIQRRRAKFHNENDTDYEEILIIPSGADVSKFPNSDNVVIMSEQWMYDVATAKRAVHDLMERYITGEATELFEKLKKRFAMVGATVQKMAADNVDEEHISKMINKLGGIAKQIGTHGDDTDDDEDDDDKDRRNDTMGSSADGKKLARIEASIRAFIDRMLFQSVAAGGPSAAQAAVYVDKLNPPLYNAKMTHYGNKRVSLVEQACSTLKEIFESIWRILQTAPSRVPAVGPLPSPDPNNTALVIVTEALNDVAGPPFRAGLNTMITLIRERLNNLADNAAGAGRDYALDADEDIINKQINKALGEALTLSKTTIRGVLIAIDQGLTTERENLSTIDTQLQQTQQEKESAEAEARDIEQELNSDPAPIAQRVAFLQGRLQVVYRVIRHNNNRITTLLNEKRGNRLHILEERLRSIETLVGTTHAEKNNLKTSFLSPFKDLPTTTPDKDTYYIAKREILDDIEALIRKDTPGPTVKKPPAGGWQQSFETLEKELKAIRAS